MRTVKNVLESKSKPANTVEPGALVLDALRQLVTVNLSYLVVTKGEEYRGVFSERDYSRKVILQGRHSDSTTVGEVMSTDLPEVALTDTAEECMNIMSEQRSRYLVARNAEGEFAGILTIHDLIRLLIHDKEDVFDRTMAGRLMDDDEGDVY